jgi:DNA-binding transcriptional MocR family regulator
MDLQANGLSQCVVERFLALHDFERRLETLRKHYALRAEALVEAVRHELPSFRFREPRGGFSLWVVSDLPGDDAELLATALSHGVSFDPGGDFRPSGVSTPLAMRLSFSSLPTRSMREAARRLARAVARYAERHAACRRRRNGYDADITEKTAKGQRQAPYEKAGKQAHPAEKRSGRAATSAAR